MPVADAVPVSVTCAHCGLDVPPARAPREDGADAFCCDGCETVYGALRAHGLARYYALRRSIGADADRRPARVTGRSFEELDDDAFAARSIRILPDGSARTELFLEGVHCAACVWLVERLPELDDGVVESRLDLPRSRVRVTWDPERTNLSSVARSLDRLGYTPHPVRGKAAESARRREERSYLMRLGISGACAGNTMAIAFALYGGLLHGIEPEYETLFRWTSLAISIPALIWGGGVFFRGALGALRARALHMDIPIALGITAGFAHGVANTVRGGGPVYFESVTMLIFLLLAGRWIQLRRQRTSADSAELLAALSPSSARLLEGPGSRVVPVESLIPGMRVEVLPGELFPADGSVVEGNSAVHVALLTGESRPVDVGPGSPVHAGTMNVSSPLAVEIHSTGEETRVGRLLRLVEEYAMRRAPIVLLADRLSGIFVASVLALAAVTFMAWASRGLGLALDHAIALLIVTCPCALGLSTPLATTLSIGQAARAGILVKGGDVLEALTRPGRVWLDKTGTLTEGRLRVVEHGGAKEVWDRVAAIEGRSNHPVARALVEAFGSDDSGGFGPARVRETQGGGIEAEWDGHALVVGSPAFVGSRCGPPGEAWSLRISGWTEAGLTPVVVALDGRIEAAAGLGDPLRPEAAGVVRRMQEAGWRVGILSGDHPAVVAAVGRVLGLDPAEARGGVGPEEKSRIVGERSASETVVMVGDGVNDAAALAAADIGVAVHGGAEAALAAADVFVTRAGVAPLLELLDGARRTLRTIRWNLVFSLVYNVVGAALAMAGLINPIVAAILMPLSSLTVVGVTAASRMFPPREPPR